MKIPPLYLVTRRDKLELDQFFNIILKSIEGGVKMVQLREKETSSHEVITLGKRLQALLRPLKVPLIMNDRVDIAHEIGADGVHLGQSDVKVSEARKKLGQQAIIGLSVETMDQVLEAQELAVDYLAASPVFATRTKGDCGIPWGLQGLKQACSISRHPVIAIGGVDEGNVEQILECGAVGVAVVSAIFDAPCPKAAALTIINKMGNYAD
jgi:thiamine-phosphate pyrophosphorylase